MDWRGSSRSTEKRSHFRGAKSFSSPPQIVLGRLANLLFRQVSFVSASIGACTSWETCYPPWLIVPLFTGHVLRSVHVASSAGDLKWTRPKVLKKLDAVIRLKSFCSLSLKGHRSAGKMARRCTYTGVSMSDRRQKFCESAARLDRLANLWFGDRTTEPGVKTWLAKLQPDTWSTNIYTIWLR